MRILMTKTVVRAAITSATLVAALGLGTFSAQAADARTSAAQPEVVPIHAGNAPQCIETWAGSAGTFTDYQTAYNNCGQAYRVKLEWAVASSDCQTLQPGESMTYEVFKPAWAEGADLC